MNPHKLLYIHPLKKKIPTKIVTVAKNSKVASKLTIPSSVRTIITAKEKNAMNALAWISGCLFWNTFTRRRPPMTNMKAVSI